MSIVAVLISLSAIYVAKVISISRQHDELIADDICFCWSNSNMLK